MAPLGHNELMDVDVSLTLFDVCVDVTIDFAIHHAIVTAIVTACLISSETRLTHNREIHNGITIVCHVLVSNIT